MPSNYCRDTRPFPDAVTQWEPSLSLFSFYFLVLISLTGLSTLLGQTTMIDARVMPDDTAGERERENGLTSVITPDLTVNRVVLEYLAAHTSSRNLYASVKLKRRFEYHFKLAGVKVVMLHFISTDRDGQAILDDSGREILHLVEVYDTEWGLMLHPAAVMGGMALLAGTVIALLH